jgi:cytochrome c-type biogenesis protein CcmH
MMKLRRIFFFTMLLLVSATVTAIGVDEPLADPAKQALYEQLVNEVRCLVCQNQTVADSNAPLAADLRREIHRMVESGQSEAEIKIFLTDRYGDFVLYRPRFAGASSLLWIAPGLLAVIGCLVLWRILRRRTKLPVTTETQDAASEDSVWD